MFDVIAVGPRIQGSPAPDVVAGDVAPVLGEVDGRPEEGARCRPLMNPSTTVRASSSRLPIRPRIFDRRTGRRWPAAVADRYMPDAGTGTRSSNSS
jgi:hypothetical protein